MTVNKKRKYKVGFLVRPMIVTEVRRPDPEACLVLKSNTVVELTDEEVRVLLHQEIGALIPRDLLTVIIPDDTKKASKEGEKAGKQPEGGQGTGAKADGQETQSQVQGDGGKAK